VPVEGDVAVEDEDGKRLLAEGLHQATDLGVGDKGVGVRAQAVA